MDDLVGMHLRKVSVVSSTGASAPGKPVTHSYDLDVTTDPFWARHCREPFPNAIEGHEEELKASAADVAPFSHKPKQL